MNMENKLDNAAGGLVTVLTPFNGTRAKLQKHKKQLLVDGR